MKNIVVRQDSVRKAFLAISGISGIKTVPNQDLQMLQYVEASCKDFRIRLKKAKEPIYGVGWILELAVKKDFDRWANSVNFVQEIPFIVHYPITIDFNKAINQARKVVGAKAFDWNTYFDPIILDQGWSYDKKQKSDC